MITGKLLLIIALGVAVFTVIEVVTLGGWLIGSNVHITTLGKVLLTLGLYLEHFVSVLVGLIVGNLYAGKA